MTKNLSGLYIALLVFITTPALSQVTGYFTGSANFAIPQVSVSLLRMPDSVLIRTSVADTSGRFSLTINEPGLYFIRGTAAGYQPWYSSSWQADSPFARPLGGIILKVAIGGLATVEVRALRPPYEQRTGGIVVNPSASVMTKGSTLLAVLQRSPGVSLDPQTNALALNGKTGVTIALNGKTLTLPMEEVVRLLNDMSADEVDRIELLSSPSSKYDAQGNAGLINIVMKKNRRRGTSGSASLSAGFGKGEKARAMISLAHNDIRWGANGSYNFSHSRGYSFLDGVSDQDFPPLGGDVNVQFTNKNKNREGSHNVSLGFDFRSDSSLSLNLNMLFTAGNGKTGTINRRIITYHADSALNFYSDIGSKGTRNNLVNSLSLEKKWNARQRAVLGADRIVYNSNAPTSASSDFKTPDGLQAGHNDTLFSPKHRGYAHTSIGVAVASLDYSQQISKTLSLETGLKGTHTGSDSRSGIESQVNGEWVVRDETSNQIRLNENIGAGYASVTASLKNNISIVAGVRYEYSRTKMRDAVTGINTVDRRLSALFPSLSFTQKLNDRQTILFSYSKRVTRPSYNDLSSFVAYNDPLSVFSGNPFLRPAISHNLKLGYNYRSIGVALLASRDLNGIAEYQIVESPQRDLMIIAPQNLQWQNNLLLQATIPVKITDRLTINSALVGGWHRYRETFTEFPLTKTWFGLSANSSVTAQFSKGWAAEVSGFYNAPSYNGTILTKDYLSLNAGIKKTMSRNGAMWQLSVTDLFRSLRYRVVYGTLTKEAFSGSSRLTVFSETSFFPVVRLTYSRSFGGISARSKKEAAGRSADEQDRIR